LNLINNDVLNIDEFEILWKLKAAEVAEKHNISKYSHQYLLMLQNFIEFFFLEHLNITDEEFIEFGYKKEMIEVTKTIKSTDVLGSLIYCAGNHSINFEHGLSRDAYRFALKLYEMHSKDNKSVKNERINKYKDKHDLIGRQIQRIIPDDILVERMINIRDNFSFSKKEVKYIQVALTDDIDEAIVFDMKDLHKTYVDYMQTIRSENV